MAAQETYFVGLREFVGDLRKIDRQFPRDIAKAMRGAAKTVERESRSEYQRIFRQGTSGRSTRTVKGIAAFGSNRQAGIKFGGSKRPWLPGQEFGSDKYKQFRPWSGKAPGGRGSHGKFVYPIIRREIDTVTDELADEMSRILSGAIG